MTKQAVITETLATAGTGEKDFERLSRSCSPIVYSPAWWSAPLTQRKGLRILPSRIRIGETWNLYRGSPLGWLRKHSAGLLGWSGNLFLESVGSFFYWPVYTYKEHGSSDGCAPFFYRLLLLLGGILMLYLYLLAHSFYCWVFCSLVFALSGLVIADRALLMMFYITSLYSSYVDFMIRSQRNLQPLPDSIPPYRRPTFDWIIDVLTRIYAFWFELCGKGTLAYRFSSFEILRENYRRYLTYKPSCFPVASFDYLYLQETELNPVQLTMMAVIDRVETPTAIKLFKSRLVAPEPKLRSIVCRRWGRVCWVPLEMETEGCELTRYRCYYRPEQRPFLLMDNIHVVTFDPNEQDIYEIVSDTNSRRLPRDKPLWRLHICQPTTGPEVTYLIMQVHHAVTDGIAISQQLLSLLFESPSASIRYLPTAADKMTERLYWGFQLLRASWSALSILFFWMIWSPKPLALIQDSQCSDPNDCIVRPTPSRRKYLLPPVEIEVSELKSICAAFHRITKVQPTVNDIFVWLTVSAIEKLKTITPSEAWQLIDMDNSELFKAEMLAVQRKMSASPSFRRDSQKLAFMNRRNAWFHRYACDFEDYVPMLLPMAARLTPPTTLDNFTSLVFGRIPLVGAVEKQFIREKRQEGLCLPDRRIIGYVPEYQRLIRHVLSVKGELDWIKKMNWRMIQFVVVCAVSAMVPDALSRHVTKWVNNKAQICVTNVMGPTKPCFLNGKRVKQLVSWAPFRDNSTVSATLVSFETTANILIAIDEVELLPLVQSRLDQYTSRDIFKLSGIIEKQMVRQLSRLTCTLDLMDKQSATE